MPQAYPISVIYGIGPAAVRQETGSGPGIIIGNKGGEVYEPYY
jgi:hypothetical protein